MGESIPLARHCGGSTVEPGFKEGTPESTDPAVLSWLSSLGRDNKVSALSRTGPGQMPGPILIEKVGVKSGHCPYAILSHAAECPASRVVADE